MFPTEDFPFGKQTSRSFPNLTHIQQWKEAAGPRAGGVGKEAGRQAQRLRADVLGSEPAPGDRKARGSAERPWEVALLQAAAHERRVPRSPP